MALSIVPIKTFNSEVKEEIIKNLEELLERAKKGEFEGFAWAASLKDGSCKTGFTRSIDFHTILSGIVMLQYRMVSTRRSVEKDDDSA